MNIRLDDPTQTWEDFEKFDAEVEAILAKGSLNKGESTGHEFRGNRYTGGIGGGEDNTPARVAAIAQETAWRKGNSKYEELVAIDSKGNQLVKIGGSKTGVSPSYEEGEKIRGAAIVTHYHPSQIMGPRGVHFDGGSLSLMDFTASSLKQNGEVRAVSQKMTSSLKYNGKQFSFKDYAAQTFMENLQDVQWDYVDKVVAGTMSEKEFDTKSDALKAQAISHFGWEYKETLNK